MSDPKDVSKETTDGGSIGIDDMKLWKVVTVFGSGDDKRLVVEVCSDVSWCGCVNDGICF